MATAAAERSQPRLRDIDDLFLLNQDGEELDSTSSQAPKKHYQLEVKPCLQAAPNRRTLTMIKKIKRISLMAAAVLCMAAFAMPLTAFAASDNEPPSVSATLNGDMLHVEASDKNSGVEATA